ncbi:MAG: DUF6288 domain-containing protein [Candidatus Sumerlaeota bacterium]|nr:DUF6288 domain-containing protein [Candidatus Sumerlaeota bacterium]
MSGYHLRMRHGVAVVALVIAFAVAPERCLGADEKPKVQDFTQGGKPDETHDWTLGATGARGWVWGWKGHTTDARQILITDAAAGSPADGVLKKGDVLMGVNGKSFADDARIVFARAITEAEKEENRGVLRVVRWREGALQNVEIKLAVMGTYSVTAPYDCPKSKRILEQGCRAIAKQGWKDKRGNIVVSIPNCLNALALLASGKDEYLPLVAEYAKAVAVHQPGGHVTWGYAYETLFLAEYAAATKDRTVMEGLRRLTMDIARGQSGVGTWGHAFARPSDGVLDGYGCMNQPGIVLTVAMTAAREAGVADPVLDRAIEKSAGFLRWWVNKGAIPYGDHDPWPWHDDNGKCSSGAVLFDLLGDREAASFYSRMGAASYGERESGHTGNFFALLWALPGVSRCGTLMTAAYWKETDWYYDLARCWDGRFIYQGVPANWGGHQYNQWDSTGAYMLAYALPLKRILLTGRKPCVVPPLSKEATAETIANGRDFTFWTEKNCYDGRGTEALFAGLASWSPTVRKRSAEALGRREGEFVQRLLKMMGGADRDARYGACEALGCLGGRADAAGGAMRALLVDRVDSPAGMPALPVDPWMRILAAKALVRMGPKERNTSVNSLLKAALISEPGDRRKRLQGALAETLFTPGPGKREPKAILADSLEGVDRTLLYPAIKDMQKNEDGRIRGLVAPAYKMFSPQDAAALMPDIVAAIRKTAPSGEMFAYGIRFAGLDLLARFRIREGMPMCVDIMNEFRWGRDMQRCIKALAPYSGAAREFVPQIREVRQKMAALDKNWEKKDDDRKKDILALDKLIATIEADRKPPALRSMEEFVRSPSAAK